jgi:hypothetical protein
MFPADDSSLRRNGHHRITALKRSAGSVLAPVKRGVEVAVAISRR